jgi:hypothetical protein
MDDFRMGSSPRQMSNPTQGGYDATSIEADGMPGAKDVGMGMGEALGPMNGNFNEGQMDQFNSGMARPMGGGPPENMVNQYMEPDNPTRSEGATGVEEYPRMKPRY